MSRTVSWMSTSFAVALGLAVVVLMAMGADEKGTVTALRITARWSFLLFWLAYAGRAIAALSGIPLGQRVREFGLSFASAHLVHLGLIAWLCWIGHAPSVSTFTFFGIAIFCTYCLALCSLATVRRAVGSVGWWIINNVGMNYILIAFAKDFLATPSKINTRYVIGYAPFVIMVILAPLLRILATMTRLKAA